MNDDLHAQLAAAIERYLTILADHGLILDAECDSFIRDPVYGVYIILLYAMRTLDPDFPEVTRLQSTCDLQETHDRLESQLVDFGGTLETICAKHKATTGVDPFQAIEDSTIGRIAVALLSTEIAAERLRADGAAHGHGPVEPARRALAELRAEPAASAIERHRAPRLAARA